MDRSTVVAYRTVFDASQQSFAWWVVIIPLAVAFVGVGILVNRSRIPKVPSAIRISGSVTLICAGLCVAIFLFASTLSAYHTGSDLLATNQAQVAEGQVIDLTSTASGKAESFRVQGVQFSYSEYSESLGFHHVSTLGGPMKEGLQVKIWYAHIDGDPSDPVILKLEISQ